MKRKMLILVMCLVAFSIFATTNNWTSSSSHSWNLGSNWSLGHEPTSAEDVYIPATDNSNYPYVTASGGYNAYCKTLMLETGSKLRIGNGTLTVTYDATIYGQLWFSNDNAVLDVNDDIFWKSGSTDSINQGIIRVADDWTFEDGTSCTLGTGNTVILDGSTSHYLYFYDANASFGNLQIDHSAYIMGQSTQAMQVDGDMTVSAGYTFYLQNEDLIVDGTLDILSGATMDIGSSGSLTNSSDFTLNGALDAGPGDVNLHGEFDLAPTGELTITGGDFICDVAYTGYSQSIRGTFNFSDGLFEISNNSLNIAATCTDNITGGTIRIKDGFYAASSSTFQPTGGVVELVSSTSEAVINIESSNNFFDLLTNSDTRLGSNLDISHDLTINSGYFKLNNKTLTVTHNVYIYDTLKMISSSDVLNCENEIYWESGSSDNITAGDIYSYWWLFEDGTNAQLGTGNTVHLKSGITSLDADAEFGNLEIIPYTRVNNQRDRNQPVRVAGNFTVKDGAGWEFVDDLIVEGTVDIESGAYLDLLTTTMTTNSDFTLNGELYLGSSGNALIHGEFELAYTGELTIDGGSFISDAAYSGTHQQIWGDLNLSAGLFEITHNSLEIRQFASTNITRGTIRVGSNFAAGFSNTFQPTAGTLEMTSGNYNGAISIDNSNNFYDLLINGNSWLGSDLNIDHDLTVNEGYFSCHEHTVNVDNDVHIYSELDMTTSSDILNVNGSIVWYSGSSDDITNGTINVSGSWHFNDGTDAQLGTGNTVSFNGSTTQNIYCYDADASFGNVDVDKSAGNFAINTASTQPMRIAGDLDAINITSFYIQGEELIVDGTLDIYDGSEMAIGASGSLTNSSDFTLNGALDVGAGDVLIHGEFDIASTGELTISGGSFISDAPHSRSIQYLRGTFNLSGGLFEITNNSLNIASTCTDNITDGTIRVGGSFYASYSGTFQPSGGIMEITGSGGNSIQCYNGNYLYDLVIEDNTYLMQDLEINNNLTINSGYFNLNGHTADVEDRVYINDVLRMVNAADELNCDYIEWNSGSSDTVTNGTINVIRDWYFNDGTDAQLGTGNTVNFVGFPTQSIYCYDDNTAFGNLVSDKSGGNLSINTSSTDTLRVDGNMDIFSGNIFQIQTNDLLVTGTLDINNGGTMDIANSGSLTNSSDFTLEGNLDVDTGVALIHGEFELASTGELTIDGGSFISDAPVSRGYQYLRGTFNLSDGLFEITNNSLNITSTCTDNITGGTIRVGGNFSATDSEVFQPIGGTVEILNDVANNGIVCDSGNYFYNLKINSYIRADSDILVNNNLEINNGTFNILGKTINVGNNINWNASSVFANSGTFNIYGNWYFNDGTDATLMPGTTVNFVGSEDAAIYCDDDNAYFDILIINKDNSTNIVEIYSNNTVRVYDDLTIDNGKLKIYDDSNLLLHNTMNIMSSA